MFGRTTFALAWALLATSPAVVAQEKTAQGAQTFLAGLAGDGAMALNLVDARNGMLALTGTRKFSYRWVRNGVEMADGPYPESVEPAHRTLSFLLGISLDSVDRSGNADPCVTRINKVLVAANEPKIGGVVVEDLSLKVETFFGFDRKHYRKTATEAFEDPQVKFSAPHFIDWGRATISRTPKGRIIASSRGAVFRSELTYGGDDPEMADRVEYAMKFLKASCDRSAATGF